MHKARIKSMLVTCLCVLITEGAEFLLSAHYIYNRRKIACSGAEPSNFYELLYLTQTFEIFTYVFAKGTPWNATLGKSNELTLFMINACRWVISVELKKRKIFYLTHIPVYWNNLIPYVKVLRLNLSISLANPENILRNRSLISLGLTASFRLEFFVASLEILGLNLQTFGCNVYVTSFFQWSNTHQSKKEGMII